MPERILDWQANANLNFKPWQYIELMGLIPEFILADDDRPAWEQIHERYAHGGGWQPFGENTWKLMADDYLIYPGDSPLPPIAQAYLRDERIIIYPHAFVAIIQRNGDFSVARID